MTAKIIDGKKIAAGIKQHLKKDVDELKQRGCPPSLAVVLVGENPASRIYVKMKSRACEELGIHSQTIDFPADLSQEHLLASIAELNEDDRVHAILVQLPLPAHIDENRVINAVTPEKDVDGFHPENRGKLVAGEKTFVPCTPLGVHEMLLRSDIDPAGKHVVIVGRSKIVGLPLSAIFVQKKPGANATVTVCHTGTRDLSEITSQADILIAAMGRPEVITADMIKHGAVVIDVGVNRVEDAAAEKGYRIVGDVEFDSVVEKAAAISPVPGGVGPMTIAMLMQNTVQAAKQFMRQ
ncbi:MAG: bifunctional methylenetetrahydrofolate dehydrogenase/methenyltetrahydrofolate cyclohydrolase FolD [bacterium]